VIDLTGLKCWRCVLNGYSTPAGDLDENDKPICVFCADAVPCPEAKRKPVGSPVAEWNEYASRVNAKHSGEAVKSVEKEKRASAKGPKITNEEKKSMPMFEKKTCLYDLCAKEFEPNGPRQQYCGPECKQAAKSGGDLKITLRKKSSTKKPKVSKGEVEGTREELQPTPNVHTVTIHEKHIDRLLVGLPIERKVEILRAELAL
jgi:hypothetical protein